ncbi:MAG: hypothetical protein ISP01_07100 [Methanobrevibacter arboriphilus]|uniref:SWIM-type domain-containing protein n=1 Tax=Methanobrevibacter arboriphilus TaxID=39441 RepID=A0A843ACP2_METAZ|nr:hypothetical protein [Methanobrevibacter arboriphilus]MBF4469157.1 hypothetical protein [Methanobrevibacter arboriphilus]
MISRIEKAIQIVNKEEVKPLLIDHGLYNGDVELQFQVGEYLVSCVDNLFRCNCQDFNNRGVNQDLGSFTCKHCLAVIGFIMNNPNLLAINDSLKSCADGCTDCNHCLEG